MRRLSVLLGLLLAALLGAACSSQEVIVRASESHVTATAIAPPTATFTPTPTPSPSPTVTPTATPTRTPTPPPSATPTPDGCQRPPDDYTQVLIHNSYLLNARTLAMLEHAQELYDGEHDFVLAITQGSYHPGVGASFGTHDGGGAVDLSVRNLYNWHDVLYRDIDEIIRALRLAGFAAWLRDDGDLYEGSPVHIHAIAIGDDELSQAARDQLTGPAGYFYGYDGLPGHGLTVDPHGGPVVCPWMIEMGYPAGAVSIGQ